MKTDKVSEYTGDPMQSDIVETIEDYQRETMKCSIILNMANTNSIMEQKELFELLLKAKSSVVYYDNGESRNCWSNTGSIYFQLLNCSYYDRFGLTEEEKLFKYLEKIVRVEKKIDGNKYPIWTKDDGVIEDYRHFVEIKGKYYTIKQLEHIFEEIEEIKSKLDSITKAY